MLKYRHISLCDKVKISYQKIASQTRKEIPLIKFSDGLKIFDIDWSQNIETIKNNNYKIINLVIMYC